jgi:dTDP-4-dehydrorhamnose 3,5-epimerase
VPFTFHPLELPGIVRIEARTMRDDRGWFRETYQRSAFGTAGIEAHFAQDNLSWSERRGTLRGLHYQIAPMAQAKLVRCVAGRIFDVAVDLRDGSATYGRWIGLELSSDPATMVWIPAGFAHGFQALTDGAAVAYQTTNEYSPLHERGIRWDDPALSIAWPVADPIVSPRDAALPSFREAGAAASGDAE